MSDFIGQNPRFINAEPKDSNALARVDALQLGGVAGPVVITGSGVARQFLHPRTNLASVIEHTRRISVFDRDEHLVCEVWVKDPESEASRKLARKRADKIRKMLDKE